MLLVRELLGRELADRLEHPEAAGLPAADEALVDQRLHELEVGVGDLLGRLQRPAAAEDGECREQLPLPGSSSSYDHSIVARSVCCRVSASRPPRRRSSRLPRRSRSCCGREERRAGGGELERERQVVEPLAELVQSSSGSKSGCAARARVTKSRRASARSSTGTG